jgi:hypothetical protein
MWSCAGAGRPVLGCGCPNPDNPALASAGDCNDLVLGFRQLTACHFCLGIDKSLSAPVSVRQRCSELSWRAFRSGEPHSVGQTPYSHTRKSQRNQAKGARHESQQTLRSKQPLDQSGLGVKLRERYSRIDGSDGLSDGFGQAAGIDSCADREFEWGP